MKIQLLIMSLAAALAMAGCATSSPSDAEKPPPKAGRVQVLMYDQAQRPKTTHLDVYDAKPPQRPYKVIALLTCEGGVDQEVVMTRAIYYRARQLGADGVLNAPADHPELSTLNITRGVMQPRCVFRAKAIVYTDE